MREAGSQLAAYLDGLDADPARQDAVERRVAALEDLARKHRVEAPVLPAKLEELRSELATLEQSDLVLGGLDERIAGHSQALRRGRGRAHGGAPRRRPQACDRGNGPHAPARHARRALRDRNRDRRRIGPSVQRAPTASSSCVSANPGEPPKPVAKVASGGELSRISLAVQVASARRSARTCMIFDEVDAGIGGGVAEIVGRKLRELGERGQVLCVTHLAQVASQAHHQHRVTKLTDGRASRTVVAALRQDERVEELARMLGGVEITRKARDHAREMLKTSESAG